MPTDFYGSIYQTKDAAIEAARADIIARSGSSHRRARLHVQKRERKLQYRFYMRGVHSSPTPGFGRGVPPKSASRFVVAGQYDARHT